MGFNISEIVQGSKYKTLMKYVYGWGASVVLLGALFKLQHYPGAGIMLVVGMCTEAIIFFLSAFEPIVEEVDWSIVYPELAGMTDDVRKPRDKGNTGVDMVMLESVITSAIAKSNINRAPVEAAKPVQPVMQPVAAPAPQQTVISKYQWVQGAWYLLRNSTTCWKRLR